MPTYQYSCTECGHFFEQFQSFSEDSLTVCPQCQGKLRKVFNAVGVVFKGSGFYRTDSRADGGKGDSRSSSGGSKDGGSKDGGSSTSDGGSKQSTGSGEKAGSSSGSGGSSSGGAKASSGSTSAA